MCTHFNPLIFLTPFQWRIRNICCVLAVPETLMQTVSCPQCQHHCLMKHKTPVGRWPSFSCSLLFNAITSLTDENKSSTALCQHQMEQIQIRHNLLYHRARISGYSSFVCHTLLLINVWWCVFHKGFQQCWPQTALHWSLFDAPRSAEFIRDFCWVTDMCAMGIWMLHAAKNHDGQAWPLFGKLLCQGTVTA